MYTYETSLNYFAENYQRTWNGA